MSAQFFNRPHWPIIFLASILLGGLSACGQIGPLYLPDAASAESPSEAANEQPDDSTREAADTSREDPPQNAEESTPDEHD